MCMLKCQKHNKKSDLDFMVADIEPDIIGITESSAHKDMVDAELMPSGYVMFRKDRQERMGGLLCILRILYKHMNYRWKRKQNATKLFGAI